VEEFRYLETTVMNLKILCRKKLRTDFGQGMLAIIWC
jgi:hypothetical protein